MQQSMKLHYYMRGAILLGFTTYIAYLAHVDKLHYYIVPRMIPYVMLTTIALYILALYSIYLAWQEKGGKHHHTYDTHHNHDSHHDHDCACQHEPPRSRVKSSLIYCLFVFPLLLGFALPDQLMGSDVVAVKGMNLSAASGAAAGPLNKLESREDRVVISKPNEEDSLQPDSTGGNNEDTATVEIDGNTDATEAAETSDAVRTDKAAETSDAHEAETMVEAVEDIEQSGLESGEGFDALFPSDHYSVELAELGKLLYPKELITVKEEGFLETLTTLDLYRNNFIGKSIKMSGFVYREPDMSTDTFVVSRMAMQCCSADASPYGFLVHWDEGNTLEKDAWIEVIGTFGLTDYQDIEIVQLHAVDVTRIQAPNDPYVYPYFDDFVKIAAE